MGVLRGAARPPAPGRAGPGAPTHRAGRRGGRRPRGPDRAAHLLPCGPQGKIAIGQGAYRKQRSIKPNLCRVFKEENGNV